MTYTESAGSIRLDGRKICNFTIRIRRYDEVTDSLCGTIRIDGVTRGFGISASGYRDDDCLKAAITVASAGSAEFYTDISTIRAACDVLAFPT